MTVLLLCASILLAGGFIVGVFFGRLDERARAERRRPLAPHEVLARLRGPLPRSRGPA